jgi:glycerophosphoryl diester phosphodiesterase
VRIVAHRGNAAEYTENSEAAIASAIEFGVDVEFDVMLSADRVPVLSHDTNTARIFGRDADIHRVRWKALRDIGLDPLSGVVELVAESASHAYVEIKPQVIQRFGPAGVKVICRALEPIRDQCTVISFNRDAVDAARRLRFAAGVVLTDLSDQSRRAGKGLDLFVCDIQLVREPLWPGRWMVYEIDAIETAQRAIALGAELLETMSPGRLLHAQ